MSSSVKYTMFNSKVVSEQESSSSKHDGDNFYFDKHSSFIIHEKKNGEAEKFKILETINIVDHEKLKDGALFKTLKGSDIYSFSIEYAIPGVMSFLKITSSCPLWEPFEGQLTQVVNMH